MDAVAHDRWVLRPEMLRCPPISSRRVGRAGTRVAATGLGQVRRMSAVLCGYQEREVQPLLEFTDGVAETVVPMGRFVPAHCERRSERGEGCGGGALTYRTTRAPSCTGRLPPDASRAGSVPLCARRRPALSPRRREPPRRGVRMPDLLG